jgi:hypothetical protein
MMCLQISLNIKVQKHVLVTNTGPEILLGTLLDTDVLEVIFNVMDVYFATLNNVPLTSIIWYCW